VEVVVGTQFDTSFDRMHFKGIALNTMAHTRDLRELPLTMLLMHSTRASRLILCMGLALMRKLFTIFLTFMVYISDW
jgi:hypothetical protein